MPLNKKTKPNHISLDDFLRSKHFHLANQSHIILYTFATFWRVSQSNILIYVCGNSIPSTNQILIGHAIKPQSKCSVNWWSRPTSCWLSMFFHFKENKNQRSDFLNLNRWASYVMISIGSANSKNQKLLYLLYHSHIRIWIYETYI